jgi:hypothetical protein
MQSQQAKKLSAPLIRNEKKKPIEKLKKPITKKNTGN